MRKIIYLLILGCFQFLCVAQDTIQIKLKLEDKEIELKNAFSIKIIINGTSINTTRVSQNKIIIDTSNLKNWKYFDIEFAYKNYIISFDENSKFKLNGIWIFKVDKRPFNKDIIKNSYDSVEYKIDHIIGFSHIPSDYELRATSMLRPIFKRKYRPR